MRYCFFGCGIETKTLEEFYEKDLSKVCEIKIVDGNTGEESFSTDQEKIDDFINDIRDIEFIPDENQEKRDGFHYSIYISYSKMAKKRYNLD
ncbi:hypothetical protein [Viridibacillus soli]|uniref:hypothetical protein n=1 Tax=Viridibacillus soli TaxID=2798301 RepID=UPI001F4402AF|nr:hypothetical protein [Viridibacillus soli]